MGARIALLWPPRGESLESLVDALTRSFSALEGVQTSEWRWLDPLAGSETPFCVEAFSCAEVLERGRRAWHEAEAGGTSHTAVFVAKKRGRLRAELRIDLKTLSRAGASEAGASVSTLQRWSASRFEWASPGRSNASAAELRRAMMALVEIWGPLWGTCLTGADRTPGIQRRDGSPEIGWITFLSNAYGKPPEMIPTRSVCDLGWAVEVPCEGRFDAAARRHSRAVSWLRGRLVAGGIIQPYLALRERRLESRGKAWVAGTMPAAPAALRAEEPAPVVAVQQASFMKRQPPPPSAPVPTGSRPADPLEPLAALGATAAASTPRSEPVLPFAPSSGPSPLAQGSASPAPKPRRGAGLEPNASFGETAAASKEAPKPALPFQPGQGSAATAASSPAATAAPSVAAPKPRRGTGLEPNASFGETAAVSREAPKAALPFESRAETASAPVPAAPSTTSVSAASGSGPASAPATPGDRTPPELSLDQYAMLCAEYAVRPEDRAAIRARYGLAGEAEREAIGERWVERLRGDPEREAAFRARVQQLVEWLRTQGRR